MRKVILFLLSFLLISLTVHAADTRKADMPFPTGKDVSQRFVGTVYRNDLIEENTMGKVPQVNVITFAPGSRSGYHVHGPMTVIGIGGEGIYQAYGQPAVRIRKGDVVQIPAGLSHWHGAVKDSSFQQIVIYEKNWKKPDDLHPHTGPVTEETYTHLKLENANDRHNESHGHFLFYHPKEKLKGQNLNHPVYVSKILGKPNEAGSPEWTM